MAVTVGGNGYDGSIATADEEVGIEHRPHPRGPAEAKLDVAAPNVTSGTWQALTNQPTFNASTMILLTNGSVMVLEEGTSKRWFMLAPDHTGSYVNGTWSQLADMNHTREYFASAVLKDGRVIVAGGEYSDAGSDADAAEIYDPTKNTWTTITTPGWGRLGDASACLLSDGRWLVGDILSPSTSIYDPATGKWTATGAKAARCDEETWTLLPDGTVLTAETMNAPNAEKYAPSSGTWVSAGSTPVDLVQASSSEIGPAILRPNGTVFCIGATGHTAIYTPPSHAADPGSWNAGPDFPQDNQQRLLKAKDAPAALLPSGNVLCVAGPAADGANDWPNPTEFFEFDGTNLVRVADPANASTVIYLGRMLLLPTGQVLYASGGQSIDVYTPTGAANASWKPVVTSAPVVMLPGGTNYTLSGRQFNGLSQAVSYGDDAQMATNYPLVRLRDPGSGNVYYCRTHDHSTMAVATGSAAVSTQVDVPASVPPGQYELTVVANGIASDAVVVQVGHELTWHLVGNTRGFGNLLDGHHPVYIGDFTGAGRQEVLFYYNGDSNWWLGTITGGALNWQLVGNTRGFGNLLDGSHPVHIGDFSGVGHQQVLFYYGGDSNWWLGSIAGGSLGWQFVGNTQGFGNLLDGQHPVWTGDFSGVRRTQVLFYYAGDSNWWLATYV